MRIVSRLNLKRNPSNFISDDNDDRSSQMKIKRYPLKIHFICGDKQTNKQTGQTEKIS